MRSSMLRALALTALSVPLIASCAADDETVLLPDPVSDIFDRYVAVGNSITAGYQSGGINDSTQMQSYPALLAQMAFAANRFHLPLLASPGCPPPFAAPFSTARIAEIPNNCAFRVTPAPPYVSNLAVPGAPIAAIMDLTAGANALTTFILGGRTQGQALVEAEPTLVTSWLGNNDALGAALGGTTALLTPLADFQADLGLLAAQIEATPAATNDAVVLLGVVNPVAVPALQPGVFAYLVKQNPQTAPLLPKSVNDNCAPVDAQGNPNPLAFNLVSLQILTSAVPEISCANDAPYVLNPSEQIAIGTRVTEYNASIETTAETNGWIYIDPNLILGAYLDDPSALRKCQGLPAALQTGNPQTIFGAVVSTCPSPDPAVGFGSLITYDGVHPSAAAHQLVANAIYSALAERFEIEQGFI